MGPTTVKKVGKGHKGKGCLSNRGCPLSITPKELGSLAYILSLGHLRFPRTCMCSSPHGVAPNGAKTKEDGRVPPKRGTKRLRNAGKETWRSRRLSTRNPRTDGTFSLTNRWRNRYACSLPTSILFQIVLCYVINLSCIPFAGETQSSEEQLKSPILSWGCSHTWKEQV